MDAVVNHLQEEVAGEYHDDTDVTLPPPNDGVLLYYPIYTTLRHVHDSRDM